MHRIVAIALTFLVGTAVGVLAQSGLLRHLNPPGLSTPTGYTHVVIPQAGRPVFIAGQVANDKSGAVVGKGDFKAQTKQVFENLKTAVEAAGATMADVAKITIYVTDLSQIAAFREVRQQYFTGNLPASTLVQVVSLARPEYLLEIEAIVAVR
jgi:reactive intermediate/imine deaminase